MCSATAAAIREALRQLRPILPHDFLTYPPERLEDLEPCRLMSEFQCVADMVERVALGEFGACVSWTGKGDADWSDTFIEYGPSETEAAGFTDASLYRACAEYTAECGWDMTPTGGWWLVLAVPDTIEDQSPSALRYRGSAISFVIVFDRDGDDAPESIAHLWTARAWRRQGVASTLVAEALARYPVERVEPPLTSGGRAVMERVAPELLGKE